MSSAEELQRELANLRAGLSSAQVGLVTAQDWDNRQVTVDLGGTVQVLPWSGRAPWPGDTVRVTVNAGAASCELFEGAPMGSVLSVGSSRATVVGDDNVSYTYPYVGAVPGVGDRVGLLHSHRLVLGAYSTEPEASEFVPSAPSAPSAQGVRKRWFKPVWSGNWSSGAFKGPDVEISTTRVGAYGFGTQIRDTIPNGANVTVAQLHLTENWDNVPGVASSMGLHAYGSRPGSIVNANLSGSLSVPGLVVDITGPFMAALQNGSAFGVGFRSGGSGWRQYGAAPGSGQIYAEWS